MPADRYWQLEDGRVDLGALEAQPYDLARLCLAEFAMTSGDDWLARPARRPARGGQSGGLRDAHGRFGETYSVPELIDPAFTMFRVASAARAGCCPASCSPPVAADVQTGQAVEEVLFLRDEMANMAWAIEQTVQGRSGDPRSRASENAAPRRTRGRRASPRRSALYRLQTPIPAHWIPLVPVALTPGAISLRKAAMIRCEIGEDGARGPGDGPQCSRSASRWSPTPLTFPGEEIPREGIAVRAVPMLARRADGRYVRWAGYRVRNGHR